MTKEQREALLIERYNKLVSSPKNIKCPGVVRKIKRKLLTGNY